jgi:hypothetical protein
MSKLPELHTFEYIVVLLSPATGMESAAESVLASYFQESGAYTILKDSLHVPIAAFRTDLVTQIRRSVDPVDVD